MIYTNENWEPPVTYCETNKVEVQRMNKQEAITLLEKLRTFHNGAYAKSIDMAIEALTADWIPCSERLPENGHYYLWCSDMGQVQSDYYWNGFENGMKYGYNIVAWMPLPKPYRNEMVGGRSDGRGRSTRETSTACHKTVGRHAKCKHV